MWLVCSLVHSDEVFSSFVTFCSVCAQLEPERLLSAEGAVLGHCGGQLLALSLGHEHDSHQDEREGAEDDREHRPLREEAEHCRERD